MWAVVVRALPWVLSGIGIADIATDWFRKRPEDEPKPDVVKIIKRGWLGWLIAAALVVFILRQTELLKKRL